MNFTPEKLKTARDNGYTDDEIWSFLGKDDQRFNLAKENGYTLDDTINTFSKISPPEEEPSGVLRQAADIPVQFAKGIGTGIRGFTDIIGADNPISKSIAGYEDYMDSLLSAESKNDSKRVAQLLQEAQNKGILDKISAGFEAFASAPIETTANVAGYMVPQLALGLVGKAAQIGKAAQMGLTLGTGFVQGVGTAKGNIYQNTKDFLREQGVAEDKIEDIAVKAQSYNGENLDQLLLSGGLNALAASTGAEAILTRVLAKEGKEVSGEAVAKILKGVGISEGTAKSIAPVIAGGGKGIVAEAPIEGVQSAQEEVGTKNIPLQRLGYDVPTFKGAIESATTGVVAGGFVGGLAGGVEALSPEQKEQIDIKKEASRRARDLESTDPATQAISTELTRLERGIDNKRMDLDALESTSPEASKMRLDIAADQKKLAVLKEQANNFGLSETITEAEKQQIELGKLIAAPPEEKPAAPVTAPAAKTPTEPAEETTSKPAISEVLGEQQASIKIKDNIQQKIDPQTGDRISVPIKDFTIETPQKGSAYGYILNNVANIVGIKAPKKEGSVIEAERGTKTYPQVIQKLSEFGVTTLRVAMPSEDSRIALEKLVLNGTLSNPRDFSGPSDASYPTTWDIVSEKPSKPVVTEEPPVSMAGKQVIPGVTPVPVVAKAPTEPTVKESLTVAPVEEEPFGKLPTAEAETALSQRTKEAAIAEEREKIEAPIRRQESINQFLSEGATVKSRTNVVGRKKAAEGGGDITKTAYYLAHPDGKREIPLSKKEASDLKAPAITPAPVAETPAVAPAPEVAPAISDETKRQEQIAIQSVDTPKKLNARLQDALDTYGVKNRKSWTIDFENKQLISPDKTTAIKWTTRNNPNEPESYTNQQTSTGKARLVKYQPTPAVSETITPAEPAGISVGSRIKLGKSPQTYIVEEAIPQTEVEKANNEQFYSVKNERTGEVQTVEKADMKQVGGKKARKMAAQTRNEEYMRLAQDPEANREQLQRMVDEAAKKAGYDTFATHRTNARFTVFDANKINKRDSGFIGDGFYFSPGGISQSNDGYGRNAYEVYLSGKFLDLNPRTADIDKIQQAVIDQVNEKRVSKGLEKLKTTDTQYQRIVNDFKMDAAMAESGIGAIASAIKKSGYVSTIAKRMGFDGAFEKNEIVVFSPNQIKSADPVTYDDAGNVIPLEERFQPTSPDIRREAATIQQDEAVTPIPEANRYTFEEAVKAVDAHFGKQGIPEGVVIVNNTTEPDLEMKAGYFVNRGQIVINLAYIAKGENLGDIIDHELGHYIFSDPEFQADFKEFWELMTPEEKAKADQIINQFYNKDTGAVQMEEKQVRAFMQLIQDSKAMPKWKQLLDKIKRWINEKLGTNLQVTDRGALAVLAAAHKRFKSGEQIVREIDSGVLKTAETAQDAEYLAAVERGDMETAQRMVDEAAKAAGYGVKAYHGSESQNYFDEFANMPAYFTTNEDFAVEIANSHDSDTVFTVFLKLSNPIKLGQSSFLGEREAQELAKQGYDSITGFAAGTAEEEIAVFNPSQIKSADPVTYDDAGNVIPLSQRFQPSEPDIRRMAVDPTGERKSIMGEELGELKDTPKNIIAKTKELLRERVLNPSEVTEKNTTEAFRALGKLLGNKQERRDFADELNNIATIVDDTGAAAEVSMGAALFVNDLFEYAVRLAAQGDKKMLGIMMSKINDLPTATEGRSDAGRALRAAREMKDTFLTMAKAEQDAFINYAAEFVYGPNPTKQQVDSIKIGYDAVEKVQEPTAKEVEEEIAAVGEKTGTDLVGRINDEFTKATEKGKAKRKTEIEELDSEYKKIQEQADKEIEKLAKIQSDTPSFDPTAARQTANDVRAIVANDLKQRPDMGRKAPWKSMLVAKLQEAGVDAAAAETLADIVWRQHEINNLSRELSSINKAVEKGPISEIIKAIKETPLEEQQNPNWRYEVMRDYLRKAGLSVAQAERIAKLMDISLQKRFTQAKEQAFTDAISKTAPWKAGDVRSKRAFQQVLQAIRAGALDPSRNMASDIAAMNGWTGFTADQYKNLLKNDAILANEDSKDIQKAEAYKAVQDIISKSKLPIRARDVIGQYYDAQALSGIPTLTVNTFSPIAFAMRNAIVQAGSGTIKGDAKAIGRAATAFVDSIKSWARTVAFSFKNNVTVYSNVDYIVNDDNLLRLYRKGVDQFTKSKNAKERADGVKNMMIGMMDYVRRILNALDYGAIASLQNQNISKYAMAVMKRQKMSDKQANEMFGVMMKAKNDFYLQQVAIGTDKNKASILADEFYISSWKEALSKAGVEKSDIQQAMDAAINDALSSVGRNRQSLDAFKEEDTKLKDAGVSSMPALWLLESIANAANRSDNQVVKLFSRVIYGFAIVPARVIRETAWFSPYGFVRFGYDYIAKSMGKTSPYAQSLGTDIQYSQRLNEAVAGTVALLGLMALRAGSTDDPEDEDAFKIVFTGNGPQRKDDAQFYDSWYKAGNKPNSMIVSFGKTKFTLNMMRGFEAFTWPAMMLGALDDLEIRKKQKQQTKTPAQLEDAAIVAGFVFDAALRRGPYAFTTKSLFGQYGDIGVEGVAKGLTFPAKTLIPVLGTSLASNISNFLNDPIDRRTLDGAVWSNIPFIGPAVAPKSLNAFGEPSLSTDLASKMFKLGVPIVYDIPTDRESIKLHELVLKQGGGPSIPTRNQLAQRLDRQPTNKEYEMFVREYGTILTKSMKKNYDKLFNAKPEFYSRAVERIGLRARDVAENKVRQVAKKP